MYNTQLASMVKTSNHTQKDTTVNTVLKTNDYNNFKTKQGNRELNQLHLKRLMSSVKEIDLLHANPILVNENFEIIDGQHRFNVCKELKKPIYFLMVKGLGLNEIQVLNANSKNWKMEDYVDGYCSMGMIEYLEFKKYLENTDLGISLLLALLCGSDNGDNTSELKNGKLKLTHKNRAIVILQWLKDYSKYYEGCKRRSFVLALNQLYSIKGYNHDKMMQKLKYQSAKLVDSLNVKTYLALLEEIYNFKERNEKLRFF
jgi:hypothetical protein